MTGTPTWDAGNGAGDTGGTVAHTADTARSEGTEVAHTAVEAGGQVASTAADATKEVAGEARRQAKDLFGEARTQLQQQAGATQRQAAGGVRSVADELRQMAGAADGGPVADLAHQAAGRADDLAGWLEQREPGDLVDHVRRLARRRPGAFLAGAALAGVLAGRLTRGVVDHERSSSDHTADRYPPAQPGHPVPPRPVTPTPSTPATTAAAGPERPLHTADVLGHRPGAHRWPAARTRLRRTCGPRRSPTRDRSRSRTPDRPGSAGAATRIRTGARPPARIAHRR